VYRRAPAASRHRAATRRDGVGPRIISRERARRARSAVDSRNTCEMGISSMSENSCTTTAGRLDRVCGDAAEASRDIATPDFRRKKKFVRKPAERATSDDIGHVQ
jgi:hypothetical protein